MCETLHPWDPLYLCQSWPQTGRPHSQVCELSPAPPGHLRIHIGQWCSWHELTITSHALKHIYNLTLPLTCTLPSNPELILHWTQMHKQHLSSQSVCAYISCPVKIDDHTGRHTAIVWCQGSYSLAKVVNTGRKLNTQPLKLKVSSPCPAQHFITCKQLYTERCKLSRAWDKSNKGTLHYLWLSQLVTHGWNYWSTGKWK